MGEAASVHAKDRFELSKRKKKIKYIRENAHLSAVELSGITGLPVNQISEILKQFKEAQPVETTVLPLVSTDKAGIPTDNFEAIGHSKTNNRLLWFIAFIPALAVVLFYLPSLNNDFVNWDDADNILNNPHIRSLSSSSLKWMLTTNFENYWMPLTWFSFALDFWIGGLNPFFFHFSNLFFHVFNTILVFFIARGIFGLAWKERPQEPDRRPGPVALYGALMAALIFGLHPIHVESVAWATERKDVLYSFFYLLGLLSYMDYAASPVRNKLKLWACAGLYLLSLMAKPMAVTLPLVFLILDYWPLRRLKTNFTESLKEKIPFFVMALVVGSTTLWMMGAKKGINQGVSSSFNLINAFHSLVFYLWNIVFPVHLVPFYPFPQHLDTGFYAVGIFGAVLAVLGLIFYVRSPEKFRPIGLAWLFYFVTILPALGFIQVVDEMAANRYAYLPSLSLFLLFSGSMAVLLPNRRLFLGLCVILALVLGFGTLKQIGLWKNSQTLWEFVVKTFPEDSGIAHAYLAISYEQKDKLDDSLAEFDRSLRLSPKLLIAHDGKGITLFKKGLVDQAIQEYKRALELDPHYTLAHQNLWGAYEMKGMHEAAVAEIMEAIKNEPDSGINYAKLGVSFASLKRWNDSDEAFNKAFEIDPTSAESHNEKGDVLMMNGHLESAISEFKTATLLNPKYLLAIINLWRIFTHTGRYQEGVDLMLSATKANPDNPEIFRDLGVGYAFLKRYKDAEWPFKKALDLEPANPENLVNLATIYQWEGRTDESMSLYRKGIEENPKEPVYYLKVADLYLEKHLPNEALEMLNAGVSLNPMNPKVVQQIGEDYERAGQKGLAQQCYAKAKALSLVSRK